MKTQRMLLIPAVLLFSIVFSSACLHQKIRPDLELTRTIKKAELLNFPESYRMVHRVRLKVRNIRYDFIGYLAVKGACCRAVAISEIGSKVFDLLSCSGEQKVIACPPRLPTRPLRLGVLSELAYIFTQTNSNQNKSESKGSTKNGITIKLDKKKDDGIEKIKAKNRASLLLIKEGSIFSEIEIRSFRFVDGWPYKVPDKFQIKNNHWGYIMLVELIRMDMRPVDKDVFLIK